MTKKRRDSMDTAIARKTTTNKRGTTSDAVEKDAVMPLMLVQAITLAFALMLGESLCSPLYVSFAPTVFPLATWAELAVLLSTMFSFIVGFALLWCCESFAFRMKAKLQPLVYAAVGAIAFGVWTVWVLLGVMNSILAALGMASLSARQTMLAGINGALLGMAAFFLASTIAPLLAKYRGITITLGVLTVLAACGGGYILMSIIHTLA